MSSDKLKTVAVLGGSYGGNRAAQILASGLPNGWRVVLVDRNSHFNHVYNLPRYTVLPGHEHKAFIPYDKLFINSSDPTSVSHPHEHIHGTITSLHPHHITYIPHANSNPVISTLLGSIPVESPREQTLHFNYAIYALGSHLPSSIELWGSCDFDLSTEVQVQAPACPDLAKDLQCLNQRPYMGLKLEGVSRLRVRQRRIEAARQVLVVGGGALGIQFASDIAAIYPRKSVTLLHSRSKLLPKFDGALGDEVYQGLQGLGVHVILGERLDMSSLHGDRTKQETISVRTVKDRVIEADLVLLCTGQLPNTSLLHAMDARTINPENSMIRVSHTMQILALGEKDTTFDEVDRDGHVGSIDQVSPTLCGTDPPSPTDTLVELDSTLVVPRAFVYPHFFAVGDATDAFGACKAGHAAYYQGEVAARNVIRLIEGEAKLEAGSDGSDGAAEEDLELEEYVADLPMIKVSLGLTRSAYEVAGVVGTKDDGTDDLHAAVVWKAYGYGSVDEEGMWM